jgi:dipeptidyl aminopeptidase/acylaminoacyl peptidase
MDGMSRPAAMLLLFAAACSGSTTIPSSPPPAGSSPAPVHSPAAASPRPDLPPYYIESLRGRKPAGGTIEVGAPMFRGAGFSKYHMSWPSAGRQMTGTISLPDGPGPFPVVIVVHGYIPASRYWVGQDSGIFGDPLAGHGFISLAPNYPGYAGSDPAPPDRPTIIGLAETVMDLVSSLGSLRQADTTRVALIGHSNGGGVGLLTLVSDFRIRAYALFAPISSDMRDNARKWWLNSGSAGPLGNPDQNPAGYAHISPRNYFQPGLAPVLILQGTSDEDIPRAWTEATVAGLNAARIRNSVTWFPDARHDLVGSDLAAANAAAEEWIRSAL